MAVVPATRSGASIATWSSQKSKASVKIFEHVNEAASPTPDIASQRPINLAASTRSPEKKFSDRGERATNPQVLRFQKKKVYNQIRKSRGTLAGNKGIIEGPRAPAVKPGRITQA